MKKNAAATLVRWVWLWSLLLLRWCPASAAAAPAVTHQVEGTAFTRDGAYPAARWTLGGAPPPPLWGSWSGSDALTGTLTLGPFRAPPRFLLAVAGYPTADGNALFLRRVRDGATQPLAAYDPHENWAELFVAPPPDWIGEPVEICAVDGATTPGGWLGLSEPYARDAWGRLRPWSDAAWPLARWHRDLAPLAAFFLNAALLLLPGLALLPALRRRVPLADSLALLSAFALSAFCGYALFWIYWLSPVIGKAASLCFILGAPVALWQQRRGLRAALGGVESAWPAALALLAGMLYLGVLLLPQPGGNGLSEVVVHRFLPGALPSDHLLPQVFADKLYKGQDPRALLSDWLSSDRPPLQAGWLLLARPLTLAAGLGHDAVDQTAGLLFQLAWVSAAWAFLRAAGCARRMTAQLIAALVPAGFFCVQSLYVWPKLGAAALAGGAFTLLLQNRSGKETKSAPNAGQIAWAATMAALGYLAHGGVLFSLLAVAGLLLVPRWFLGWQRTLLGAAVFLALCLPWTAYQKGYNPPGDRLLKWHLAGVLYVDERSLGQAVRDAYASRSAGEIAAMKRGNLLSLFRGDFRSAASLAPASAEARRMEDFFHVFRTLGVFNLGWSVGLALLLWQIGRRKPTPPSTQDLLLATATGAGGLLVWGLLFFDPPGFSTLDIHYGPYLVLLQFFAVLAMILWRASRTLFQFVAAWQFLSFAATYAAMPPAGLRGPPPDALAVVVALLAGATLAWIALTGGRQEAAAAR